MDDLGVPGLRGVVAILGARERGREREREKTGVNEDDTAKINTGSGKGKGRTTAMKRRGKLLLGFKELASCR